MDMTWEEEGEGDANYCSARNTTGEQQEAFASAITAGEQVLVFASAVPTTTGEQELVFASAKLG